MSPDDQLELEKSTENSNISNSFQLRDESEQQMLDTADSLEGKLVITDGRKVEEHLPDQETTTTPDTEIKKEEEKKEGEGEEGEDEEEFEYPDTNIELHHVTGDVYVLM